jgi:glycosyltransferase involved in cell wall biosynthesis
MRKNTFLGKYYKPWSFLWVLQRFIMVFREGRLFSIQWKTLLNDFRLNKEIKQKINLHPNQKYQVPDGEIPRLLDLSPVFEFSPLVTCEYEDINELSLLNSFFDKIYVVNLEKRADRRIEMVQKLTKLKIRAEFFRAEDGYSDTNVKEYKTYFDKPIEDETAHDLEKKYKRKVIYSPGAWGTLKTYERLLTEATAANYEKILCLQDDVIFHKDFEASFSVIRENIPAGWKLIYLGATQHAWKEGEDLITPEINPLKSDRFSIYHPVNTDGAFAVGISRSAFPLLLEEISRMNCSFDSGALRSAAKAHREASCVIFPNLVIADVKDSDIRASRKQDIFAKTARWDMDNYDYPFKNDLVSVIMPAFNAAETISQSIKSILAQDYHELELIVVDDCSTDNTASIVRDLAKKDARIRYVKHDENSGCYASRNTGIRYSKGKYITFQDADDISLQHRINLQIVPLILGKAEFTLARIMRSRERINDFDITDQDEMIRKLQSGISENSGNTEKNKVGYITAMFKRNIFEELGLFWENRFGADAEFVERLLFKKAGFSMPKNIFAQNFLTRVKSVDHLYERIDKIVIISFIQGEENLSRKHKDKERLEFQERWRARLRNEISYDYPEFSEQKQDKKAK